jgi:nucleoid-associated protein YgaU
MKQNNIQDLPLLNPTNFENIFNVYQDSDSKYFYNILQTIALPTGLPDGYFNTYTTVPQDTWPYISYKVYGRIDLWWLIAQFNGIVNPTTPIDTGIKLRIPTISVVNAIIDSIT